MCVIGRLKFLVPGIFTPFSARSFGNYIFDSFRAVKLMIKLDFSIKVEDHYINGRRQHKKETKIYSLHFDRRSSFASDIDTISLSYPKPSHFQKRRLFVGDHCNADKYHTNPFYRQLVYFCFPLTGQIQRGANQNHGLYSWWQGNGHVRKDGLYWGRQCPTSEPGSAGYG